MNDIKTLLLEDDMLNFNFAKYCITLGGNQSYNININKILNLFKDLESINNTYKTILVLCECCKYVYKTRERNKGKIYATVYRTLDEFNPVKPKSILRLTKWSGRKDSMYKQYMYLKDVSLCLSFLYGIQHKEQYVNVHKNDIVKRINKSKDCLLVGLKSLITCFDNNYLSYKLQEPINSMFDYF